MKLSDEEYKQDVIEDLHDIIEPIFHSMGKTFDESKTFGEQLDGDDLEVVYAEIDIVFEFDSLPSLFSDRPFRTMTLDRLATRITEEEDSL